VKRNIVQHIAAHGPITFRGIRDLNPKVAADGQGTLLSMPVFAPANIIHRISHIFKDKHLK
jgi:hypothetical protein